jgi:hypothetical protein
MVIGNEPLQISDGNGGGFYAAYALALALIFLRANPAANGGEGGGILYDLIRAFVIFLRNFLDEGRDIDAYGTTCNAGFMLARKATRSL